MRVQFDRVLRYPKEVHDEDDKLAAAFFARAVYACLMSRREFEKSRFPPFQTGDPLPQLDTAT